MESTFTITLAGISPIIMHTADGLDATTDVAKAINEIAKKKGSNRTIADELRLKELECQRSFWLKGEGTKARPTVPPAAIRACIESAARTLKQGPNVRGGLLVEDTTFHFDEEAYGTTMKQWRINCQFTTSVVVQRNRILRTRAKFEPPWSVEATIEGDDELIDQDKLFHWLSIGGRRFGLGDWRPEKSGIYGRFTVEDVTWVKPRKG